MIDFDFRSDLIQVMAEHRTPFATALFQLFTLLGEIEGYIFVVAAIYAAFDKRLAFRLAVLALVTMSINHVMKTIIANPRPFVVEGSFSQELGCIRCQGGRARRRSIRPLPATPWPAEASMRSCVRVSRAVG